MDIKFSKLERISKVLEVRIEELLNFNENLLFQKNQLILGSTESNNMLLNKLKDQYERRISLLEQEVAAIKDFLKRKSN